MKLIIATNNAHKAQEIRQILADSFSALDTLREAGLAIEVVEDGATFAENAVKKAEQVLAAAPGYDAALSDDSGLAVDALGGAPGVYSARYAGPQHDDADNNRKQKADMAGVPDGQRGCRFVCAVALARRGRPTVTAEGACEGVLLRAPRGENGFGYDPYFYDPPAGRTFAELTGEAKNAVSHRRRALESLRALLAQEGRQRGA